MIIETIRSINSLILINLIFFFNFSKKKTIIFNFPREQVAKKDLKYIKDLFKDLEKKYLIFYIHKVRDLNIKSGNNYFMQQYLLKFIFNADYLVSNYISDFFPYKSKKIYIHHCITDCPLTDKKKDIEIAERFHKYDFILINSKYVKKYFDQIINRYCRKFGKKNSTTVLDVGYPRIDYLFKKLNSVKLTNNQKSVIIAPANFLAFQKFSLIRNLEDIIDLLLKNLKYKVIFRPHPQNRRDIMLNDMKFNKKFLFLEKYKNNKRFVLDTSDDYLNNYRKSSLMISDLSGTAFTFSYLTNNPVLFFSINEKNYKKYYSKFEHFKLRSRIGLVCNGKKSLIKNIEKLFKERKKIINKIVIEKKRLKKLSMAKNNINNFFRKIA